MPLKANFSSSISRTLFINSSKFLKRSSSSYKWKTRPLDTGWLSRWFGDLPWNTRSFWWTCDLCGCFPCQVFEWTESSSPARNDLRPVESAWCALFVDYLLEFSFYTMRNNQPIIVLFFIYSGWYLRGTHGHKAELRISNDFGWLYCDSSIAIFMNHSFATCWLETLLTSSRLASSAFNCCSRSQSLWSELAFCEIKHFRWP